MEPRTLVACALLVLVSSVAIAVHAASPSTPTPGRAGGVLQVLTREDLARGFLIHESSPVATIWSAQPCFNGLVTFDRMKPLESREHLRLLHIAPDPQLGSRLKALPRLTHGNGDPEARRVDVKLDVMQVPFPDRCFDAIICNHLLEHVTDDRAAMAELHRVLRAGRSALLQVPIGMALEDTVEPAAVADADRIRLFGQRDHVRLYAAADYVRRLERAGFRVALRRAAEDVIKRHALLREEPVFLCEDRGTTGREGFPAEDALYCSSPADLRRMST